MSFVGPSSWIRSSLRWFLISGAIAVLTAILLLIHATASTAGILYVVLVVWVATLAGPRLSMYLAVVCAILFDYFFLEPRYSIEISGVPDWLSMIAFVASCIVVSRVAERARRQTRQAEQRREDVERLYSLSQEMMLHEDAQGLVREIPLLVERNFALDAVLLHVRDEDHIYATTPVDSDELLAVLRSDSAVNELNSDLPDGYSSITLAFGMKSVGTLVWKPPALSREVATSIAAQVAIAITRAHAIEGSTQLEAARAADRLRSALIDSLTHELRTPLTAIRAAATTLLDGHGLDEESRTELATIVDEESSRLNTLIGAAVEMAEIEADAIRVRIEPVFIATFLEQAVQQSHDQLASRSVSIETDRPESPVWFDPRLLGRVLRHLLENAARYTPPDSRIVLRGHRAHEHLEFLVEDDGPGIDVHDLPHVFEKFYRGKYRGAVTDGSGMGLAITRAILAAHGGVVEVESAQGKGTTFRFRVPLIEKAPASLHES